MSCIVYQTNKKTGITYAYESVSYWDKEKQQPRSKRQYIGRVDDETGEIIYKKSKTSSNDNIQEKDSKANTASCLSEQEKIISNLREENEELKKKLSAALGTIEKIKGVCEEM